MDIAFTHFKVKFYLILAFLGKQLITKIKKDKTVFTGHIVQKGYRRSIPSLNCLPSLGSEINVTKLTLRLMTFNRYLLLLWYLDFDPAST